jgi:hypothetical protein
VQTTDQPDIAARLADPEGMERAFRRGVYEALRRHKLLGESIVTMDDGRIVEVPADQIELPEINGARSASSGR